MATKHLSLNLQLRSNNKPVKTARSYNTSNTLVEIPMALSKQLGQKGKLVNGTGTRTSSQSRSNADDFTVSTIPQSTKRQLIYKKIKITSFCDEQILPQSATKPRGIAMIVTDKDVCKKRI